MTQTLILEGALDNGKKTQLSIANPRTDLTVAEINSVENAIITKKFFLVKGSPIVAFKKAYVRTVEEKEILEDMEG